MISALFESGIKIFEKHIFIRAISLPFQGAPVIQVLFAVSKKNANAVKRNRLKRVMREALFHVLKGSLYGEFIKRERTFQVVFHPRVEFESLPPEQRDQEIGNLLARLLVAYDREQEEK